MSTLKNILPNSVFGTIGTVVNTKSLDKAYSFIEHNLTLLKHFDTIILSTNSMEGVSKELVQEYHNLWHMTNLNVKVVHQPTNTGHMLGTRDLDEAILEYVREHLPDTQYIWKSTDDMLLSEGLLDVPYDNEDFFYLPGYSYESIIQSGKNFTSFLEEYEKLPNFTPQTNFYIIRNSEPHYYYLYGADFKWKFNVYLKETQNYEGLKPWDMQFDDEVKFDMETHLGRTTQYMTKKCLMSEGTQSKLFRHVKDSFVGDPSHKNIMFDEIGVCHYHDWERGEITLI